jgi:hypothetical protein
MAEDLKSYSEQIGVTLAKAKKMIRDDNAHPVDWIAAAGVILSEADKNPDLFSDLLQCLKRGGSCQGTAVIGLYSRSGRPWPGDISLNSRDPEEWRDYLIKAGLLKPE